LRGQALYDALVIIAIVIGIPLIYGMTGVWEIESTEDLADKTFENYLAMRKEVEHTTTKLGLAELNVYAPNSTLYCRPTRVLRIYLGNGGKQNITGGTLKIYITRAEDLKFIENITMPLPAIPQRYYTTYEWRAVDVYPSKVEYGKNYYIEVYAEFFTPLGYQHFEEEVLKLNCTEGVV